MFKNIKVIENTDKPLSKKRGLQFITNTGKKSCLFGFQNRREIMEYLKLF